MTNESSGRHDDARPDDPDLSTPVLPTLGLSTRRKALIGALVAVIVSAGVLLFTFDSGTDSTRTATPGEPSDFHQIEITTLEGDTVSFAGLAGKPVLLNFFASWCGPCVAEMPTIQALSQEFADEITVVGLAFEGARPAREIVESTGVTYLTGLDQDGTLLERFDGIGMPTTVFIDSEGNIVDTHIGELSEGAFRDKFHDLLGVGDV